MDEQVGRRGPGRPKRPEGRPQLSAAQRGYTMPKAAARVLRRMAKDIENSAQVVKVSVQMWFAQDDGSCQDDEGN